MAQNSCCVSIITKIEVLGYHLLTSKEKALFEDFFSTIDVLGISEIIANTAIHLKQNNKLTLGDSLIAATAIENNLKLITKNVKDFNKIKNLKLHNPF
jgi:predicted nucleic acid-binding protein